MICKNCSAEIDNSSAFCTHCGAPVEREPVYQQQSAYQPAPEQPVYQQPVYQKPPYQAQQTVYQPNTVAQPETAPVTKIKSYIGWSLIPCIPIVGFILMIVFAVDGSNKNRANYFRAQFAVMGIAVAICIFVMIIAFVFSFVFGVEIMDELYYML